MLFSIDPWQYEEWDTFLSMFQVVSGGRHVVPIDVFGFQKWQFILKYVNALSFSRLNFYDLLSKVESNTTNYIRGATTTGAHSRV